MYAIRSYYAVLLDDLADQVVLGGVGDAQRDDGADLGLSGGDVDQAVDIRGLAAGAPLQEQLGLFAVAFHQDRFDPADQRPVLAEGDPA